MEFSSEVNPPVVGRGRKLTAGVAFFCCATLIIAVIVLRLMAPSMDHGVVNILTLILGFFAWLGAVVALACTKVRVWRPLLALPFIAAIVLFSLFKFERVDSELIPQFKFRWSAPIVLPGVELSATESLDQAKSASASTDYPQFLGPLRNAVVANLHLNPNWNDSPPKILWRQPIGDGWSSFAVQGDIGVTMEQREQQECVAAYDISNGHQVWMYSVSGLHTNVMGGTGPRATPTIYKNRVYTQTGTGKVVCLELTSGKLVWQADLLELSHSTQAEFESAVAWGRSASPLVTDDRVVIPLGGKPGSISATLIALDSATGQSQWQAGNDQISYSSPTIANILGVRQILYVSERALSGYDLKTGAIIWNADWPSSSKGDANVSQPVPLDDSHILISKGYGAGSKVLELACSTAGQWTVAKGKETGGNGLLKTKFTTCVIKDGYAYGLSDGILECVDTRQMRRQWKQGRYRHGQILLVGEHLLITSEGGELVLVAASPDKFSELGKIQVIGDVTWNTPALSGNRLIMRNSDEVACVSLPVLQ